LAFSCKGRWFCPSCHQKKVQLFGALLAESILYPVPHRHFVFGIPKMLRPYFRYDRDLLKDLCRVAHECLIEFLRTSLGLPEGVPGIVMAIHTFGEYLDFHPHLHALVADGLSSRGKRLVASVRRNARSSIVLGRRAPHPGRVCSRNLAFIDSEC
jgi:Putative transposase/Transposase zinc-binding domain